MIQEYRRAGDGGEWDVREVEALLRAKGYLIGPAGIGGRVEFGADGMPVQIVEVDLDPHIDRAALQTDLNAFQPTPDPKRDALMYLRRRAKELRAKTPPKTPPKAGEASSVTDADVLALLTVLGVEG